MTRTPLALLALVCTLVPAVATAQDPAARAVTSAKPTVTALMVEVTVARYLGEKKLSSTPYSVSVAPDNRSSLRIGGEVPVPSTTFAPAQKDDAKPVTPLTSYGYRTIGTNIDVATSAAVEGRYRITLTIEESSIYPPDLAPPTTKTTGAPAFRSFKSSNSITMRDGQSLDYMMATDRLTGEVYRITVRMTVVQ